MTKLHASGEEVPEAFLNRADLAPDLSFYLARFWELCACRADSMGSVPARLTFETIGECYDRLVSDVTDFETFYFWIRHIDSEFRDYMTPTKDREDGVERMRAINRERAND